MPDALEASVREQAIEAAHVGANPDRALGILDDAEQIVTAEAVRIVGIVAVMAEGVIAHLLIQPRRLATAPDPAATVDQQRGNIIAGQ